MAVLTSPGETLLTRMPYFAHSIANVCVILRTPAFEAPYGAEGTLWVMIIRYSQVKRLEHCSTLFGLYEAIDAVNTIAPLMLSLMNARAATLAQ
jgi:hypothetical protein